MNVDYSILGVCYFDRGYRVFLLLPETPPTSSALQLASTTLVNEGMLFMVALKEGDKGKFQP
jgi:hypothetical protein